MLIYFDKEFKEQSIEFHDKHVDSLRKYQQNAWLYGHVCNKVQGYAAK